MNNLHDREAYAPGTEDIFMVVTGLLEAGYGQAWQDVYP